jgi:uncharacterized membrane protein YcaP (DUF421 family)
MAHGVVATISNDLFQLGIPVLEKVIRTVCVYGGLVILLRLGGKRDLAQLNSFDFVVLFLLSNIVQNAVIGNDSSLAGGLLGAATLVGVNSVVVRVLRRSPRGVRLFEGSPTVLVENGHLDMDALKREGLLASDVMTSLRRQGADDMDDVKQAVLAPGGNIVVELTPEGERARRSDVDRLEAKLDRLLALRSPE